MYTTLEHRCYIYSNTTSPHTRIHSLSMNILNMIYSRQGTTVFGCLTSALIILCIYDYGIYIHYIVHTVYFCTYVLFESSDAHKMFNIYVNTCLYCM